MPGLAGSYRRAVAGAITGRPGDVGAPSAELVVPSIRVDTTHLARYARTCGYRLGSSLPPTYPHIMAFPLMLELMTRPSFPFVVTGLVHLHNHIEQDRPLDVAASFEITVRAENLRDHPRGRTIDVVTLVASDGRALWHERSTYLRKLATPSSPGSGSGQGEPPAEAPAPASAIWRVGTEVGPSYASVSGDRNPIHSSRVLARLFGFPRPIAHGMWTAARCLAALEGRLPSSSTIDISFKAPVLLPATVAFSASMRDGAISFTLRDARSARPHVLGSVAPL